MSRVGWLRLLLGIVLLALATGVLGACLHGGGDTTSAAAEYGFGALDGRIEGRPDAVVRAVEDAMEAAGWSVTESASSAMRGEVVGRTADGARVRVEVEGLGRGAASRVSVRIGLLGDEPASRALFESVRERVLSREPVRPPHAAAATGAAV